METWGRQWERVTPRSARSWATVREVIELPRSACRVSWPAGMLFGGGAGGDEFVGEAVGFAWVRRASRRRSGSRRPR